MFEKLKHFIWHKKHTQYSCKTYLCGIRIRKKSNPQAYIDNLQTSVNAKTQNLLKKIQNTHSETQKKLTALSLLINDIQNRLLQSQNTETTAELKHLSRQVQLCFNELNFADLLHDTIIHSPWLKDRTLSLFGWAANYSFIYTLYRILDKVRPLNILEMGLGQTTHLTSQYIAYNNPQAHLIVCEHNTDWINIVQSELPNSPHSDIHHFELEYFDYEGKQNDKYAGLLEYIGTQKFDLIIVDGPIGGNKNLPRSNILNIIHNNNLADDFIIIFDDAERSGEQETIRQAEDMLSAKSVAYFSFERQGTKRQHIITSASRNFVQYL